MDEENKKGVEETEASEEQPASEVEGSENEPSTESTSEEQSSEKQAHSQDDFPDDPNKQKEAFYKMRKRLEKYEKQDQAADKDKESYDKAQRSDSSEEDDFDFVNLARGVTPDNGVQQPPQTQKQTQTQFDESDPATKAWLEELRATRAEAQRARAEALRVKADVEDREVFSKYPELNPKSKDKDRGFIRDFQAQYLLERNRAISSGKQPPRLVDVADKVQDRYKEVMERAKKEGASKAQETIEKKEAASIESRGTSVGSMNTQPDQLEELKARVRRGDSNALMELNRYYEENPS